MSKPVLFSTVPVDIPIRKSTVKELLEDAISEMLVGKDESYTDATNKAASTIANLVLDSESWEYVDCQDDVYHLIDDIVTKAVQNGAYTGDLGFCIYCSDLSPSELSKLKKILAPIVKMHRPVKAKKEVKKEDPCITELKSLAKKLGYTLSKNK